METNYKKKGVKFEIVVRDENWAKLDTYKCDTRGFSKVIHLLERKYGLEKGKNDRDIDWLRD